MGARAKSLRTSKGTRQRFFPSAMHACWQSLRLNVFSVCLNTQVCSGPPQRTVFSRREWHPHQNLPWPRIELGTSRSSVWRSPNWAIAALSEQKITLSFFWTKSLPKDMLVDVTQRCFSPSNLLRTLARTLCLSGRNPNVRESFDSPEKNYPRVIFSLLRVMIMSGN